MPSDLSQAVLLNRSERRKLQERIDQQQVRNKEQRELNNKARQQVVRLTRDIKDKRILLQGENPAGHNCTKTQDNDRNDENDAKKRFKRFKRAL